MADITINTEMDEFLQSHAVLGVIRPNASGVWRLIPSGHPDIGIASISQDTNEITVTYDFTGSGVHLGIATADETLAPIISCGTSVSAGELRIQLYQKATPNGFISYNGATWDVNANSSYIESAVWDGDEDNVVVTFPSWVKQAISAQVTHRGGTFIAQTDATTANSASVKFYNFSGTLQTTETTDMKIRVSVPPSGSKLDPAVITSTDFPNGNIWIFASIPR